MRRQHTHDDVQRRSLHAIQPLSTVGTERVKDEDDTQSLYEGRLSTLRVISILFPKRLFSWIYSLSLFILILLMLAFASITPIDVIVRTTNLPQSAGKIIIVIIMCVIFLLMGILIYFLRLYKKGLALSEIPSKSVYIPGRDDLPKHCYKVLEENLQRCVSDIKWRASPLYNEEVSHPGLSPPESIQRRNFSKSGRGALLPPNTYYEDVVGLVGYLVWMNHNSLSTEEGIPSNYSFRKIILYLWSIYPKDYDVDETELPNINSIIDLYEKFRFGPDLIKEDELFEFMLEFHKLDRAFINYLDNTVWSSSASNLNLAMNDEEQTSKSLMQPINYEFLSSGSALSNLDEEAPSDDQEYQMRSNNNSRRDRSRRSRSISPTSSTTALQKDHSLHSSNNDESNTTTKNFAHSTNKPLADNRAWLSAHPSGSVLKNKLSFASTNQFTSLQY